MRQCWLTIINYPQHSSFFDPLFKIIKQKNYLMTMYFLLLFFQYKSEVMVTGNLGKTVLTLHVVIAICVYFQQRWIYFFMTKLLADFYGKRGTVCMEVSFNTYRKTITYFLIVSPNSWRRTHINLASMLFLYFCFLWDPAFKL